MSRGPGRVQWAILECAAKHDYIDARSVAAMAEGMDRWEIPDRILKSYGRAMRKLIDAGALEYVGIEEFFRRSPITFRVSYRRADVYRRVVLSVPTRKGTHHGRNT
jgi:hypothetical protein